MSRSLVFTVASYPIHYLLQFIYSLNWLSILRALLLSIYIPVKSLARVNSHQIIYLMQMYTYTTIFPLIHSASQSCQRHVYRVSGIPGRIWCYTGSNPHSC